MLHKTFFNNEASQSYLPKGEASCPFYAETVSAGFPSPVEGSIQKNIDLNEELILNPISTFFVKAKGDSMIQASIHNNDVLIVDRSIKVKNDDIVVVTLNTELMVRRIKKLSDKKILLHSDNSDCPTILVTTDMDFSIWGVVTTVIHSFKTVRAFSDVCTG